MAKELKRPDDLFFPTKPTGIRRTNTGAWAAIKGGRMIDTFHGPGAKRLAIQAAGTNKEVS